MEVNMAGDKKFYDVWWQDGKEQDQSLEDSHDRHWNKVLKMIEETDLTEKAVFDFGCNQGGFLRCLYSDLPFKTGMGVDLAAKSVEVANSRKGNLPIEYIVTDTPEQYESRFDVAFSISVMYLLTNLEEHARKMKRILKNSGVYYATYTDYSKNPALLDIKKSIDTFGAVPMQLHSLNHISEAFFKEDFSVSIGKLPAEKYIPVSRNDEWFKNITDRMQFEYEEAYIFRFVNHK